MTLKNKLVMNEFSDRRCAGVPPTSRWLKRVPRRREGWEFLVWPKEQYGPAEWDIHGRGWQCPISCFCIPIGAWIFCWIDWIVLALDSSDKVKFIQWLAVADWCRTLWTYRLWMSMLMIASKFLLNIGAICPKKSFVCLRKTCESGTRQFRVNWAFLAPTHRHRKHTIPHSKASHLQHKHKSLLSRPYEQNVDKK